MKNIIHISTNDFYGAGSAALRIHKNLINEGYNSLFLCKNKNTSEIHVKKIKENKFLNIYNKILNRIENIFKIVSPKYYFLDKNRNSVVNFKSLEYEITFKPDIIFLYWISGFIDLKVIERLSKKYNCKVYWYLMDMAPMTGGCHYSWECEGYKDKCKVCPAVGNIYKNFPLKIFNKKEKFVNDLNIEPIACTKFLYDQLRESTIFKNKTIHEIMLGIDETIFKSIGINEIKKIKRDFNISLEKRIIFFGATNINEERKGLRYLLEALEILSYDSSFKKERILLLIAGKEIDKNLMKDISIDFINIGYLHGDANLVRAYQISDLFISPSIEDSGPMMINESILCGTPVLSFDMGVARDLVLTRKTGYRAKLKDTNDLAFGLKYIMNLSDPDLYKMKDSCKILGIKKVTSKEQIKSLINLIEKE